MISSPANRSTTSQRGFTLVEVTIILLVLVVLSTIMLPQLGNFNRLARKVKVMEDLGAICATLKTFFDQVAVGAVWENPGGGVQPPTGVRIGLLHGPGNPPADHNDADFHQVNSPSAPWSQTATANAATFMSVNTDAPGNSSTAVDFGVDRFEHHLMVNDPFADRSTDPTSRYSNSAEWQEASFFLSWKGPYFDSFTPDPWGSRYLSNVFGLHTVADPAGYFTTAVVCFSAGPDRQVSTRFNQPMGSPLNGYGWMAGADDVAVVLSSGGPF